MLATLGQEVMIKTTVGTSFANIIDTTETVVTDVKPNLIAFGEQTATHPNVKPRIRKYKLLQSLLRSGLILHC